MYSLKDKNTFPAFTDGIVHQALLNAVQGRENESFCRAHLSVCTPPQVIGEESQRQGGMSMSYLPPCSAYVFPTLAVHAVDFASRHYEHPAAAHPFFSRKKAAVKWLLSFRDSLGLLVLLPVRRLRLDEAAEPAHPARKDQNIPDQQWACRSGCSHTSVRRRNSAPYTACPRHSRLHTEIQNILLLKDSRSSNGGAHQEQASNAIRIGQYASPQIFSWPQYRAVLGQACGTSEVTSSYDTKGETLAHLRPASSWDWSPRPDEPAARINSSAGAYLRKA